MICPLYSNDDLFLAEMDGDEQILNFSQFISDLNFSGLLTHKTAIGVVAYVDENGTKRLSPKQMKVLSMTLKEFSKKTCARCQSEIGLDELFESNFNKGLCNYCQNAMSKDD